MNVLEKGPFNALKAVEQSSNKISVGGRIADGQEAAEVQLVQVQFSSGQQGVKVNRKRGDIHS